MWQRQRQDWGWCPADDSCTIARMSNVTLSPNRLEFSAEAIPLFVKALLTGLSMLIYVPAADQLTGLVKYVLSNLRFSDGTTAQYTGTAEELKQPLIGIAEAPAATGS